MRVKILFWNYNVGKGTSMAKEPKKADPLARMAKGQGVDVLIVAECTLATGEILASLLALGLEFAATEVTHERIRFFRRSSDFELISVLFDDRIHFFRLTLEGFEDVLVGATHLYGRRDLPSPESRHSKVGRHCDTLIEAEGQVGHDRTLLVGDFNMTPTEMGMVDPENAFGAMMTWDLARVHSDPTTGGLPRFYNPIWSLMGRPEAPGTYYWNSTDPYNVYWYCLDGVIVRPSLRGVFRDDSLAIVATIPDHEGREIPLFRFAEKHWKIEFSDHLPIVFELDLRAKNIGVHRG